MRLSGDHFLLCHRHCIQEGLHRRLSEQLDLMLLEERHHAVIEQIRRRDRRFAIIELAEGHLGVGVDEGLLVDAAHTLEIANRKTCPGRRNSPDARLGEHRTLTALGMATHRPP
jgi:hypothetical protein